MLIPAFTFKIGQQIHQGLVVVGKFDGISPSLACGTTGGKIILHSPHEVNSGSEGSQPPVRLLNFNKKITALAAGSLEPDQSKLTNIRATDVVDNLFVGTESNLLAYDVDRNSDVFFRDTQDGVNSLVLGVLGGESCPLIVAGGNCSVLGFDKEGTEAFWTVTADNISSLAICDVDGDGAHELLVGSDDFEIRVFKNEEIFSEVSESERVTFLTPVQGKKFAYGLSNGTVGVYSGPSTRLWRVKTKNVVTAMETFDMDSDGVPEVVTGWANGQFNIRKLENGESIFKETMGSAVAAIVRADYRLDGKEEIMICSESGEVRGYLPADAELISMTESGVQKAKEGDQKALEELQQSKTDLVNELAYLETRVASIKTGDVLPGALPQGTTLSYTLSPDIESGCVQLRVEVSTDAQIAHVIAIDLEGGVLEGSEVLAMVPSTLGKIALFPLRPAKNQPCLLRVQTHVSARHLSTQLHVFDAEVSIPRFAGYKVVEDGEGGVEPNSQVTVRINESVSRFAGWITSGFIAPAPIAQSQSDKLKICFVPVCRPKKISSVTNDEVPAMQALHILCNRVTADDGKPSLRVRLRCDDMDLAADLVQDIARYFKILELEAEADFPEELLKFEEVCHQVEEFNSARIRLAADMADDSQKVKALIVRAEDSRLMVDMDGTRRAYTELFSLNNQLIGGYNVRASNHSGLLTALKEVNQMIQRAASLRVGKAKQSVIADCRAAVKTNNMPALTRIIRYGCDSGTAGLSVGYSR